MSSSLLAQNNLFWDDTKTASDHFPIIVDFVLPMLSGTQNNHIKHKRKVLKVIDCLGREIGYAKNNIYLYIYDDGTVEKKIITK